MTNDMNKATVAEEVEKGLAALNTAIFHYERAYEALKTYSDALDERPTRIRHDLDSLHLIRGNWETEIMALRADARKEQ